MIKDTAAVNDLGQGRTDDGQDQWDAMHVRNLQESDLRKDALRLSPVAAGHAPQVFDLRGRRVVRESVSGNRRKDSHAMSARTHGVFIVRSHRYTTPFARIVSLDQIK
jgi:hypothetical protein